MRPSYNENTFKIIQFIEADVRAYCALFQQQYTGKVPVLMCAQLWPHFDLFSQFLNDKIILTETRVAKNKELIVDQSYHAHLTCISQRQIKNITKYQFCLQLIIQEEVCVEIEQTFIKEGGSGAV